MRTILAVIIVFILGAASCYAAPNTPETRLNAQTEKMLSGLSENQMKQFAAIRSNHGVIRSVQFVKASLFAATESCSKNNPDIKDTVSAKYSEWKSVINPTMDAAKARQNEMIKLQDFATQATLKSYLKAVDDVTYYKQRKITEKPIVAKDECMTLIDKLDETKDDLNKLLIDTLNLNNPLRIAP